MTKGSLATPMARGLAMLASSRGVVLALQFVTMALLADHLGPSGLGVFTFGIAAANLFRFLPNFGTVQVAGRDIAQAPERERRLLPNLIYLRLGLGAATYGLLAASMLLLGFDVEERRAALIAGLVVLVVIDAFRASLELRLRLGWVSIADTVEAVATVAGVLLLIRGDAGPEAFLWLYAGLKLVNGAIVMAAALRMGDFAWRLVISVWPPLLRAAVPLGLAGLLMALYFRLDVLLLAAMKPQEDVGQYGAAYRFLEVFTIVPTMVMSVLAPVMARSFVEGEATLQRRYSRAVHLVAVLALGASVAGAMTAWRLLPALPGFSQFEGGGIALSVLAPAAGLILVGTVVQGVLIAGHRQQRLLRIAGIGLAVNVALNLALIPPYSYTGAAIATTATEALLIVLSLREVRLRLSLRWPLGRLWPALGAAAVMALALVPGYALDPFLQLAVGLLAYAVVLAASGALRRSDIEPFLPRS